MMTAGQRERRTSSRHPYGRSLSRCPHWREQIPKRMSFKRCRAFLPDSRIGAPHATPAGVRDDSASAG